MAGDPVEASRGESGNVVEFNAAVMRAPANDGAPAGSQTPALGNVIRFVRSRQSGTAAAPPIELSPQDRPAPHRPFRSRSRIAGLLVISLLVHGSFFVVLNREPEPTASIGEEAISVDIVVGANL